jgi:hypothetical protein
MINALTDDAFAMQIFTALVGAGLMALLGAWLEFNKRLNDKVKRSQPSAAPTEADRIHL